MAYNLTFLDTGNNFYDFALGLNRSLGSHFITVFLFILWITLVIVFKNYDTRAGIIAASAITSLLTILFWALQWISWGYIFVPLAVLFGALMWKGLSD